MQATAYDKMIIRNLALLATMLVLAAACGSEDPTPTVANDPAAEPAVTAVFNCEANNTAFTFTVRTMGQHLALWLPMEFNRPYVVLESVRAASGAKYEVENVMVWLHGDEAMLDLDGQTFKGCRRDAYASIWEHAKLNGVDFRATGNEPGWTLEISGRVLLDLNYDYGASRIQVESSKPVSNNEELRTTYTAESDGTSLTIDIFGRTCTDSMSGAQFESTVTVNIGDRVLHGCGRALH